MHKILVCSILCSYALANSNSLDILQKDKKEYRELEKSSIEQRYDYLKYDWLSPIDISGSMNRNHSFDDKKSDDNKYGKSASIGFTQSVFESGGIGFKIDYAKDKFKYDLLSWENQNSQILYNIYNILLDIKKLKLEKKQSDFRYINKDIELIIKKIQYDAGKTDIIELNNAIMTRNLVFQDGINVDNSIKDKELELSKYTDLKYEEIEILDFKPISKDDFMANNFDIMQEEARVDMLNSNYKVEKSKYLPKVTISARTAYENKGEDFNRMFKDTNKDDASATGTLNVSMPLYDYNKTARLQESKIEVLKQRSLVNDLKNETAYDFEQIFTKIDTYEKFIKTTDDNIKLYDDLIRANKISNEAGMTAKYDLEILQNTKEINIYDLLINEINILKEYSTLYFKVRG